METLDNLLAGAGRRLLFLTGAGISAESGIPTFRGEEGFWRVGSKNYHPQEMATWEAFSRMPDEVWSWYLYRRSVCLGAEPNIAHRALAALERVRQDDFTLVTQNVDGLHLRARSSEKRTLQIHGNVHFMRCAEECTAEAVPLVGLDDWKKDKRIGDRERAVLKCKKCGAPARPHVLWFDESYDEERYRCESAMRAARQAELLVVIGTSGATTLPLRIGAEAKQRGIPIVAVNPEPSPFTEMATHFAEGKATEIVPGLCQMLAR